MSDLQKLHTILSNSLECLAKSEESVAARLKTAYSKYLQTLNVEDFPVWLQDDFGQFQKYLNEIIISYRSKQTESDKKPGEDTVIATKTQAKKDVERKVIRSLISLFSEVQTHRSPEVDRSTFLKTLHE